MATASTTRVCIKNLPLTATEHDVKEFLKESSNEPVEITDCKVLKNAKGKSRKVAFVGFRQEQQAKFVVDNFHRTFMGMSRLSVETALAKKTEDKTNVDSKTQSNENSKKEAAEKKSSLKSKHKEEILQLVGGAGTKSKFWANDEDAPVLKRGDDAQEETPEIASDSDSDTSSSSEESGDDEAKEASSVKEPKASTSASSDMDFLRSKQKGTKDLEKADDIPGKEVENPEGRTRETDMNTDSEDDGSDSSNSDDSDLDADEVPKKAEPLKSQEESAHNQSNEEEPGEDDVADIKKEELSQSRLFVRNLPFETSEEELEDYFSKFGTLVECHIPVDDQKRNKGFAFVQYASAVDALEARKQLDKVDFQGRLLHILQARPAPSAAKSDVRQLSWKEQQEKARKEHDTKNGGDGSKGWSASFVRGDAVVDNLADRLGLRKGDILGVKDKLSSGDAAVRLALGETQIIEENREYFREHGVDMEALVGATGDEKTVKRSKTAILVKNLPYDTSVEELNKLFQTGDDNVTILLPPSRTIALVEYGHSVDAKRAFRKLAYRRFKHVPIYLEWVPISAKNEGNTPVTGTNDAPVSTNKQQPVVEDSAEHEVEVQKGSGATIYLKNLNFGTTEDNVRQLFEKNVGIVRSVRIPQKVAPAKNGESPQILSMGYGFVELDSEASAKKAIAQLQGKLVDGHAWEVTISSSKKGQKQKSIIAGKNPTKLVVRNVPFQASRKDLLKLFGTFGQLRKVRLPKKFDGSHRGFAFVEFLTSKEAVAAMTALSRTHLYGRHLVLEWATDDDQDIDRLREKAKRDAGEIAQPKNKKIRFD